MPTVKSADQSEPVDKSRDQIAHGHEQTLKLLTSWLTRSSVIWISKAFEKKYPRIISNQDGIVSLRYGQAAQAASASFNDIC